MSSTQTATQVKTNYDVPLYETPVKFQGYRANTASGKNPGPGGLSRKKSVGSCYSTAIPTSDGGMSIPGYGEVDSHTAKRCWNQIDLFTQCMLKKGGQGPIEEDACVMFGDYLTKCERRHKPALTNLDDDKPTDGKSGVGFRRMRSNRNTSY